MKIIIVGGGTAGHVNPALTIANLIVKELNIKKEDILFVGTKRGIERDLVPRENYNIQYIKVRGFERKLSINTIKAVFALMVGLIQSRKIIKKEKPNLVIGTGGYVAGPIMYWASKYKIPTFLHESNALPGITSKILASKVDVLAINFKESKKYFKKAKKVILTGNPIRDEILELEKEKSRQILQIKKEEQLVVVMGGSGGALAINDAMVELINTMYKKGDFKLIYAPGKKYYENVKEKINKKYKNIEIKDYIYNSPTVYNAANLIVSRGGAMSLSEILAIGLPSIIIPSHNVAENHQEKNARAMEKEGACLVVLDKDLNGKMLYNNIMKILNDKEMYNGMHKNAYKIGIRDGKKRITKIIKEMLEANDGSNSIRK